MRELFLHFNNATRGHAYEEIMRFSQNLRNELESTPEPLPNAPDTPEDYKIFSWGFNILTECSDETIKNKVSIALREIGEIIVSAEFNKQNMPEEYPEEQLDSITFQLGSLN